MSHADPRRERIVWWAKLFALGFMAAMLFVGVIVGISAAQTTATPTPTPGPIEDNASYYDNESGQVNTTEWVPGDGNTTAARMLEMISRVPGMFIGVGGQDPSGSGFEGFLLTGLVIAGSTLFATLGTRIGPVAGSMIGMVLAYGLTATGWLPPWIQPLLLFGIVGVPASVAILRVFRR